MNKLLDDKQISKFSLQIITQKIKKGTLELQLNLKLKKI